MDRRYRRASDGGLVSGDEHPGWIAEGFEDKSQAFGLGDVDDAGSHRPAAGQLVLIEHRSVVGLGPSVPVTSTNVDASANLDIHRRAVD